MLSQAYPDLKDHLVPLDNLENPDSLVHPLDLDYLDRLAHKDLLEYPANLVSPADPAL